MPHRSMKQAAHAVFAANLLRHGSLLHRRTRIMATLGPASSSSEVLERMFRAGVNIVRLNFSHGTAEEHKARAENVRRITRDIIEAASSSAASSASSASSLSEGSNARNSNNHGSKLETVSSSSSLESSHLGSITVGMASEVAIVCDLQGPKIRVGTFPGGSIELVQGASFVLDVAHKGDGSAEMCGVDYEGLAGDVKSGDLLLLNDGLLKLLVNSVEGTRVHTTVTAGGTLGDHKGINKAHGGLTAPALTEKDMRDIVTAAEIKADYIAVSFPKSAEDMLLAKRLAAEAVEKAHPGSGHVIRTIAKVERSEAVDDLDAVIEASDAVMVARGDLGVEVGQAMVPGIQKRIIRRARELGKAVITATQMMESMIVNPVPTRAEVSDVANAVLDGTDAVMLSAESAAGKYPVETVEWLHRICLEAERTESGDRAENVNSLGIGKYTQQAGEIGKKVQIDQGIAVGALFTARITGCRVIACVTACGDTARRMSRPMHDIPVVAITTSRETCRRLAVMSGVVAVLVESIDNTNAVLAEIKTLLKDKGLAKRGDRYGITFGEPVGVMGGTNTLMIKEL